VGTDEIYDLDVDIYAPCALGATVNSDTIPRLKCAVIAGAANNQLADESVHGHMLMDKGIIYAPDFPNQCRWCDQLLQRGQKPHRERNEEIY
jgi:leucine dehydrogenase